MSTLRVAQAVVAVFMSIALTSAMSWLFHGAVRSDFVVTGIVAAMIINAVIDVWTTHLRDANQLLRDQMGARDAELRASRAAASVAHEVKNPLTAVIGNLELARESLGVGEEDVHEARRSVDAALLAAHHVLALVGDLSTAGTEVDLAAAIDAAVHIAAPRTAAATVIVSVEPAKVTGQRSRVVQIVLNLLINAALAGRDGAPNTITVRATRGDTEVHVVVADTGRGMSPEVLARVFEPGFSTRLGAGGSGLGLSIVKDLVEGAGGRIHLDSRVGVGTEVHLWLRSAPARAAAASEGHAVYVVRRS